MARSAVFALIRTATIGKLTRGGGAFRGGAGKPRPWLDQPNGSYVTRACDAELGDARCGVDSAHPVLPAWAR